MNTPQRIWAAIGVVAVILSGLFAPFDAFSITGTPEKDRLPNTIYFPETDRFIVFLPFWTEKWEVGNKYDVSVAQGRNNARWAMQVVGMAILFTMLVLFPPTMPRRKYGSSES